MQVGLSSTNKHDGRGSSYMVFTLDFPALSKQDRKSGKSSSSSCPHWKPGRRLSAIPDKIGARAAQEVQRFVEGRLVVDP